MPLIIRRKNLAYFSVPKVACTSIKNMLHEMKTGEPFKPWTRPNGKTVFVHNLYSSIHFDELPHEELAPLHKITIIRDPITRFLSAYSNRVVHHRELSKEKCGGKLAKADLPPDPDLSLFIDRFEDYVRTVPVINHHTLPMVTFLGTDPGYFSRVYDFSELKQLETDMQALTETTVPLPRLQTGGPKLRKEDLTPAQIDRLNAYYAADYATFGDILQPT
ncbi:sulfotransferase family 2 domain-containing protein [Pararhodobacter zhoushanensis]|uniref:sulfotransferase family 2 domain-containing protein n=1 Tax=Pararhodobacter zhoushanensis TaxID=2479545 RepID=UPI000F8EA6AB|nr:sulfotransferase family 2 domain-containing protein [Pararhodobacter zhoushanensis]